MSLHKRWAGRVLQLSFAGLSLLAWTLVPGPLWAAKVLMVEAPGTTTTARQQVETAAEFYGLRIERLPADSHFEAAFRQALQGDKTVAVVMSANALAATNREHFLAALKRQASPVALLVAGISERTDPALLRRWSSGAITGAAQLTARPETGGYIINSGAEVTGHLEGARLPLPGAQVAYLLLDSRQGATSLMDAVSEGTKRPVLVDVAAEGTKLWFDAESQMAAVPVVADPYRQQAVFAGLAPMLMFIHSAAGEWAWHAPGSYANFTIDDLWLREPYGHVNYEALLREAQDHNFHTTLAFVPWNFDRSEPKMVSLFREHEDRFSICVHGNNHVHQEFGPLAMHPLAQQGADMEQALARMERFTQLTKIPYDRVMVFPHSVAPEATFDKLKRLNYLATANSLSVPSDREAPAGTDFALRTASLDFGGFPSLRRYSAETDIPVAQLAIDAFLGNPMLFYAHESFFSSGIDAFDKTADTVNRLAPRTEWRSLGYIARHLYLEKQRDDGGYDIRAYSNEIEITNTHGRDAVFSVEKPEAGSRPTELRIDGKPQGFEATGGRLRLVMTIPAGQTRHIAVRYGGELNLAAVDVGRSSLRVNGIRLLSDFRDNAVSNSKLGRWFIHSYAENGFTWNAAMAGCALCLGLGLSFFLGRLQQRSTRAHFGNVPLSRAN